MTPNIHVAARLLSEYDEVDYGAVGYLGLEKREEITGNEHFCAIDYRLNRRMGSVQKVPGDIPNWEKPIERRKSPVRLKAEPPFLIVTRCFGYGKTVCRGQGRQCLVLL